MTSNLWIFLSPHLDDAIYSCGGLIWQCKQAGDQVEIWSVFSGDPPRGQLTDFAATLHARWGIQAPSLAGRRIEDLTAASLLGAIPRHLNYPESIYRRLPDGLPLVNGEEGLWQPVHQDEVPFMYELSTQLAAQMPDNALVVCPMAIGGHVDHRMVREASQNLQLPLFYYPDFPYAAAPGDALQDALQSDWTLEEFELSPDALQAWQEAVAAYHSQLSTFWNGIEEMRTSIQAYFAAGGGSRLWFSN